MNWDALGASSEFLGAIVLIASILYLSRQIRESNKHASAEVERHAHELYNQYLAALASNRRVLEIWRSGAASFVQLAESDKVVFQLETSLFMNHLEMVLRMQSKGLLSADMVNTFGRIVVGIVTTPGGREWWNRLPTNSFQQLSTEFINHAIKTDGDSLPIESGMSYFVKGFGKAQ